MIRDIRHADARMVLVKRYAGTRFYNTETLSYMTLEEMRGMVLEGHRLVIRDAGTGDEVTRKVLNLLH